MLLSGALIQMFPTTFNPEKPVILVNKALDKMEMKCSQGKIKAHELSSRKHIICVTVINTCFCKKDCMRNIKPAYISLAIVMFLQVQG